MAEDDIYGNKKKYERFKGHFKEILTLSANNKRVKYVCKNPENMEYFQPLFEHIEAKDLSYIRRLRLIQSMKFICHFTTKDLAECERNDINRIIIEMHKHYPSPHSKTDFIKHIKYIWKLLFPEKDQKGRPDDTLIPYPVRHLNGKIDKSRQKMRKDKLTWQEFEQILDYFSNDPRMQAYLTLSLESLARPQELLYLKTGNVEMHDNYAKIWLTEHGKEGTGLLQCIDSYPYLLQWLTVHPLKKDKNAYLFINTGNTNTLKQLHPKNINNKIRKACKELGIDKPVTCYSLKRNGVTIRRLRGDSDMEIQHAARWTSTKQLKTYDLSSQNEAFKLELQKKGLIPTDKNQQTLKTRTCTFCNTTTGFGETICPKCKRPLNRQAIQQEIKQKDTQIQQLQENLTHITNQFQTIKQNIMQELMQEILQAKNKQGNYNPPNPELNGNLLSSNSSKKDVKDLPLASSSLSAL